MMLMIRNLLYALDPRLQQFAQRVVWTLKGRLSVPMVAALIAIAMLAWAIAGLRLRGGALLLWMFVPVLAFAASVCVAGPGRLFNKEEYEGRVVFEIARKDAVTMLDVVGLGLAAAGMLLALVLVSWRVRTLRQQAA
jgi:ABC-type glycerol-3-phosphate transport system permease component